MFVALAGGHEGLNVLDLFSGIGGFSLGLERAGMTTVAFCEIEPFPRKVLQKNFPGVPIYDDVRKLTAERLRTDGIDRVDLICGGFPCQPFSVAGKQRGKEDNRHLWPEMFRLVQECQPDWVIGENVAGFVEMALCDVSADLEGAGYEVQPFIIPACAVDAPHRRDRVWIVAYRKGGGLGELRRTQGGTGFADGIHADVSDSISIGRQGFRGNRKERVAELCKNVAAANRQHGNNGRFGTSQVGRKQPEPAEIQGSIKRCWPVEPGVGRVAYGIPRRVDRLRGLGNAVVPQIPEIIGRAIIACARQAL